MDFLIPQYEVHVASLCDIIDTISVVLCVHHETVDGGIVLIDARECASAGSGYSISRSSSLLHFLIICIHHRNPGLITALRVRISCIFPNFTIAALMFRFYIVNSHSSVPLAHSLFSVQLIEGSHIISM